MDKTDVPFIQIHQPSLKAVSRFTADEVRHWRHEPNEVIALRDETVAA